MSFLESYTQTYSRPVDRRCLIAGAAVVALAAAIVIAVGIGPVYIGPKTVLESIMGQADGAPDRIVRYIRLPRVLLAAMVGANLAMSGALLQGVTRNPLADPHVFGISSGAGVAALASIMFIPNLPQEAIQPIALVGGLVTGGLAYAMAWRAGTSPMRLALAGIALTAMLTSLMSGILVTSTLSTQVSFRWLVGGLSGLYWNQDKVLLPYFLIGTLAALVMSRQLNVISLGDEVATGLGQHVERTRLALVVIAALLASSAVSVVGLIGFVGLIVPHFARLTVGNDNRFLVPVSALYGATLLVLADTAARTVLDPQELPVGVLTALMGGPVFIYLVRKRG